VNTLGSLNSPVMNTPGSHDSPVMNTPRSLDSPVVKYTGESITNLNNSSNIRKNLKSCLSVFNGTRRSCLMKKNRVKKSRDTVPLKGQCHDIFELLSLFGFDFSLHIENKFFDVPEYLANSNPF
jgi:hypothetical protein